MTIPATDASKEKLRRVIQEALDQRNASTYSVSKVNEICTREFQELEPSMRELLVTAITATAQQVACMAYYSSAFRSDEQTVEYRRVQEQIATLARGPRMDLAPSAKSAFQMFPTPAFNPSEALPKRPLPILPIHLGSGHSPILAAAPPSSSFVPISSQVREVPRPSGSEVSQTEAPTAISKPSLANHPTAGRVLQARESVERTREIRTDLWVHAVQDWEPKRKEDVNEPQSESSSDESSTSEYYESSTIEEIPGTPQPQPRSMTKALQPVVRSKKKKEGVGAEVRQAWREADREPSPSVISDRRTGKQLNVRSVKVCPRTNSQGAGRTSVERRQQSSPRTALAVASIVEPSSVGEMEETEQVRDSCRVTVGGKTEVDHRWKRKES